MSKKNLIDIITLTVIGLFISIGLFHHFSNNYILSVNFYLGCICCIVIGFYKYYTRKGKYLVFLLLVFLTFNILLCSASIATFESVHYLYNDGEIIVASPGVNPLLLLLLIIYSVINIDVVRTLFYGTEEEVSKKLNVSVDFYYKKFNSYSTEELADVFKIFKEYPAEAQMALKKIREERNLTFLEF